MSDRFLRRVSRLIRLSAILMAGLIIAAQVQARRAQRRKNAGSNNTDASKQEVEEPSRVREPRVHCRETGTRCGTEGLYLSGSPASTGLLKPWYDLKAVLERKVRIHLRASPLRPTTKRRTTPSGRRTTPPASTSTLVATWTFLGRGTGSPTMLGFDFLRRDTLGTDLPPQTLFTQFGSLYSTAAPFGENVLSVGELWIQQKFSNVFGFRMRDRIFPHYGI